MPTDYWEVQIKILPQCTSSLYSGNECSKSLNEKLQVSSVVRKSTNQQQDENIPDISLVVLCTYLWLASPSHSRETWNLHQGSLYSPATQTNQCSYKSHDQRRIKLQYFCNRKVKVHYLDYGNMEAFGTSWDRWQSFVLIVEDRNCIEIEVGSRSILI